MKKLYLRISRYIFILGILLFLVVVNCPGPDPDAKICSFSLIASNSTVGPIGLYAHDPDCDGILETYYGPDIYDENERIIHSDPEIQDDSLSYCTSFTYFDDYIKLTEVDLNCDGVVDFCNEDYRGYFDNPYISIRDEECDGVDCYTRLYRNDQGLINEGEDANCDGIIDS
jgi:hypothetical protein